MSESAQLTHFAQCLTENDVVMYGADWCESCQNQKRLFAEAFEEINYVNCDFHQEECQMLGIDAYPVWVVKGELNSGVKTLDQLSALAECRQRN